MTGARRAGPVAAALIAAGLLVAACGGTSGPGVASLGSTSTTTTTPAAASQGTNKATGYLDAVEYSACVRAHGVPNFPNPTSDGDYLSIHGLTNGVKVDYNSSGYTKANKDCQHLLPNGGHATAAQLAQFLAQALKYAACIRSHGIPGMPDPKEGHGGISQQFPRGVSPNSPQLKAAMKACRAFVPAGSGLAP